MSGGSFNDLHRADLLDGHRGDIENMAAELDALPGGKAAAARTRELLTTVQRVHGELEDVWRAVEYWRSADYGPADVAEALADYNRRAGQPTAPDPDGLSCANCGNPISRSPQSTTGWTHGRIVGWQGVHCPGDLTGAAPVDTD